MEAQFALTIQGAGIVNNSGKTQTFTTSGDIFEGMTSIGSIRFFNTSTAGNATIFNNGSDSSDSTGTPPGGLTEFHVSSSAGNATITNSGGTVGGLGGITRFFDSSDGGTARAITNGNGILDISGLTTVGMGIGSIEGSGNYFLGSKRLSVGGNNLSSTVSGVIQDGGFNGGIGGSLTKVGTGTLILTGANTYSGGTTISAGTLQLGNGGTTGSIVGDVVDNGTPTFNRSNDFFFDGGISGTGGIVKLGNGTLNPFPFLNHQAPQVWHSLQPGQKLRAFCPLGPARINFQGTLVGAHRLRQKLRALWPLSPSRLVPERVTQVVLGRVPVLRQLLARVNFQGTSVGAHRLGPERLTTLLPSLEERWCLDLRPRFATAKGADLLR
jgi:autotransporter-associated beta strand protein